MNHQPGAYQTFGTRLAGTVGNESQAIQSLWDALSGLKQGDTAGIQQAINAFRANVSSFLPSYQTPTDPWDLGSLPGAGGTEHEGGVTFNPNQYMKQIYDRIAQLRGTSPDPSSTPTTPNPPVPTTTTQQPVNVAGTGPGLVMPQPAPTPGSPLDMRGGEGPADIGAPTRRRFMGV